MGALAGLLSVLTLLFLLVVFLGLVAPSLFKDRKTGKVPPRWHLMLGGTIGVIVSLGILGSIPPRHEIAAPVVVKQPVQVVPASSIGKTAAPAMTSMGMTPEEFRQVFNGIVVQYGDYRAEPFKVESAPGTDVFMHAFAENVAVLGLVNQQDGALTGLIFTISAGDKDLIMPIAVLFAAAQALNPNVPEEENKNIVMEMFKQSVAALETEKTFNRVVGNLQYTAVASRYTGVSFSIGINGS